jgi:hypothetical protein
LEADDLARDCKLNFGQYADDDALVFNFASDAIASEKIDTVEPIGFQIGPHPIESRSIERHAGQKGQPSQRGKPLNSADTYPASVSNRSLRRRNRSLNSSRPKFGL